MSGFPFGSEYTIGIEEELMLVDRETLRLAPVAAEVLSAMQVDASAAGHEAYAAQLELRSPASRAVGDAIDALADLRCRAVTVGATLLGAGLHPAGELGDAELVPESRYERIAGELRGLLRRTPEAALHVHVGLPDGHAAVAAFNHLRSHLPLLQALSAASPWWFGVDSGYASARFLLARAYPGRGVPGPLRSLDELEALTDLTLAAAGLPDPRFLWWDLRLHAGYGTIEMREMDAQASLEDVGALAALVRALALEARSTRSNGELPSEALTWSAFRAARDGTSATVLDGGRLQPVSQLARETVERVRPFAEELGDEDALDGIERILTQGGGAGRQQSAFASGGLEQVLRTLVGDTSSASRPPRDAVARRWLEARAACDLDRLAALTAADAVWASPIDGRSVGRAEVLAHVEAGFSETESFATELLRFEQRGDRAVALVHNVATRNGDELDSRQVLVIDEAGGRVTSVRIEVDDPEAVERFWED